MFWMLKLLDRDFKIVISIILKDIVEKVDKMYEYMGNIKRE